MIETDTEKCSKNVSQYLITIPSNVSSKFSALNFYEKMWHKLIQI